MEDNEQQLQQQLQQQHNAASLQMPPIAAHLHQLHGGQLQLIQNFWQQQLHLMEHQEHDFKNHQLPLARIKRVMKTDEEVKSCMISAEAPILFAKACEIFTLELTMRAWIHTEENKRRTLQKSDIAMAISKTDTFDFLIDIVPREDALGKVKKSDMGYSVSDAAAAQYFYAQQAAVNYPNMLQYQQQQQHHEGMTGMPSFGGYVLQDESAVNAAVAAASGGLATFQNDQIQE